MAESSTPRKFFKFIKYTPTTKKTVCVICGNKIEKSDYRRKLFHGAQKTEHCILIERHLDLTVLEDNHTDTACRKCLRELQKIDDTIKKLKEQYNTTICKLYDSHGKISQSFKRHINTDESSFTSRKALFSDGNPNRSATIASSKGEVSSRAAESQISEFHGQLIKALTEKDLDSLKKIVSNDEGLHDIFINYTASIVQKEIQQLALKSTNSVLRQTSVSELQSFTIRSVLDEWDIKAPTFLYLLKSFVTNKSQDRNTYKKDDALLPGLVSIGAKLLSIYNKELSLYQHLNSLVLWKGGLKKSGFSRLSATYDCFSYQAVLNIADKIGNAWDIDLAVIDKGLSEKGAIREICGNNIELIPLEGLVASLATHFCQMLQH